ncbi:hypothetical protein [Saccharothrix sp. Mg75]|uniref:hypothetical protein n=1 Tax=Saccharothrix sp. Mg75 TaxID=3445357 RepID=UPI003EE82847
MDAASRAAGFDGVFMDNALFPCDAYHEGRCPAEYPTGGYGDALPWHAEYDWDLGAPTGAYRASTGPRAARPSRQWR